MYILSMILTVFFAIIGLCAFIAAIIDAAHNSASGELLIVLKSPKPENAEAAVRRAARLCTKAKGARLICVCESESPAYPICEIMKRDYPFMELIDKEISLV